jgi:hypothetical protein
MTSRFEVQVSGRLPQTLAESMSTRFGPVTIRMEPTSTVLTGRVCDQAALRALLDLIWDTGGSLLSVILEADAVPRHRLDES